MMDTKLTLIILILRFPNISHIYGKRNEYYTKVSNTGQLQNNVAMTTQQNTINKPQNKRINNKKKSSEKKYNNNNMSRLSGYDSDAIGFDSITLNRRDEANSSAQTSEFSEMGVESQTHLTKDSGSLVTSEDFDAQDEIVKEYPPPGLNEFLRKVVPTMLEQLDNNEPYNSSDSDNEDVLNAKLLQQIKITDLPGLGGGDASKTVLALSWSKAGNSLAVSIGNNQHENWCNDDGLIRIFTLKKAAGDIFVKNLDVTEKSCISVIKYHPAISALMAYGTISGDVVLCDLNNLDAVLLSSPSGSHGFKRVTDLQWADNPIANSFLTMHVVNTGKRRNASDNILISSGSDGLVNVWQVNANLKTKVFENVISYLINGSKKMDPVDISCFDFIKAYPLRPSDEKVPDDVFVVGSSSGNLFLCKTKSFQPIVDSKMVDPVYELLDGHGTCIIDVAFSIHKPNVFISASIDSEVRVYDINQTSPLKVICLDVPISCMTWLPNNPFVVVLGLSKPSGELLKMYNVHTGRALPIDGLNGPGDCVTAISVNQSGVCRIAAGDGDSNVRVWELPSRPVKFSVEDLDF